MKFFDTIIIGGGAAAWAAALYAKRYNLSVLVVEGELGGETALAGAIENYPGILSIDGFELIQRMKNQAVGLGAETLSGKAELVKNFAHCFEVRVGRENYQSQSVILATGMEHRKLGLGRESELKGRGVHYCATCDGPLFKGKRAGVVGGGDSAVKWASQLSDMGAAAVTLFVREPNLNRAEPINRERLKKYSNINVLLETVLTAFVGGPPLKAVRYKVKKGKERELALDGVFVAIGAVPRSELPAQLGVKLDKQGQIDVDPRTMKTSVDGVFACGDVTNASGSFKQIVTSAAQGAIAATSAYLDLSTHHDFCALHAVPVAGLLETGAQHQKNGGRRRVKTKSRRH
ncbi:FAD-binding protein [Patescibacteria group bacterium]|nr:MAG: FAD-binding protein [Patescibacteria group bacterium]